MTGPKLAKFKQVNSRSASKGTEKKQRLRDLDSTIRVRFLTLQVKTLLKERNVVSLRLTAKSRSDAKSTPKERNCVGLAD